MDNTAMVWAAMRGSLEAVRILLHVGTNSKNAERDG